MEKDFSWSNPLDSVKAYGKANPISKVIRKMKRKQKQKKGKYLPVGMSKNIVRGFRK